ncbi:hypothetical protein [Chitinophaga filiformis]|uniref:LTXXQ motif family protein n=1 Tax=Chitinophaga filiformis TaxID=104663 RepID=A0ABY4I2C6_CHIFI|nr:hypothetical protein [Chitinophaga filiformis]UPK69972.1 hypothetical protein MYF79_01540 [Chitinophaga filiformis]
MNRKIFIFILMMSIGFTLKAQSRLTEEQKEALKERFQEYKSKLNLSADQAQKVRAIDSSYLIGLANVKRSSSGKLAKLKQFKSLNSEKDRQMEAVLNDEQFSQYEKFKEEMRQELKENRRNN